MNKEEKISFLEEINKKKEKNNLKKKQSEINEIKENHNELLSLTGKVKDFLDVYKTYDESININKPYIFNIHGAIKIANKGITIGFAWGEQTITITMEDVKYNIKKKYNGFSKYKTNDINDLLDNIDEDMYYILSCLQERLIVGTKEYIQVKNKEIEEYIRKEIKK